MFLDSNVPMYVVGGPHVHKADASRRLQEAIAARERLVTDAEVFQEILHRYIAIGQRDAIQPAFDSLLGLVDEVFAIDLRDVERAKAIAFERRSLSARDCLHVAILERYEIPRILSFDGGFDGLPGISRLS